MAGKPVIEIGDTEETWFAKRFSVAEAQLQDCWSVGGRYWEIDFRSQDYIKRLRGNGCPAFGGLTCEEWWKEFDARWNVFPKEVSSGVCVPANCTASHIRTSVFSQYVARVLRMDFNLPPPTREEFENREMTHWSKYRLDFVIAGVNSCGTTSLYTNLAKNPDIDFTVAEAHKEDGNFFLNNRVLPYVDDVTAFNSMWHLSGRPEPKLRGLDHPEFFRTLRIREALSRVTDLKVVLIVCDPLSRFEKIFWLYYYCRPGAEVWALPTMPDGEPLCWPSMAGALEPEAGPLLERWAFAETLRFVRASFGPRLHLVHQDALRERPGETFAHLAEFLGATPFAEETSFRRANSAPGARTNVCGNETLVRALQHSLADEYAAIEEAFEAAGEQVPDSVLQRRTRCERPDELRAPGSGPEPTTGHL